MLGLGGFLLARQASGHAAAWARSSHLDAVWIGASPAAGSPGAGSPGAGSPGAGLPGSGPSAADLAARIRGSGVDEANVFAGQLSAAGQLTPAAGAGALASSLRAAVPGLRLCAWVTGATGIGHLNLDDAATRAAIVGSARAALREGFTGLQLDLGPVASGDAGLLTLLTSLRALRASPLAVMTPKVEPLAGVMLPAGFLLGHPVFWTAAYLGEVAARADQVTVLAYSTGLPFPSWYSGYVSRETAAALAVVPARTTLLIGVPAFTESTTGHHGSAETVRAAIAGVRSGLTASGRRARPFGVGLVTAAFPDAADWAAYRSGWAAPAA
jgi:hypothetical protein